MTLVLVFIAIGVGSALIGWIIGTGIGNAPARATYRPPLPPLPQRTPEPRRVHIRTLDDGTRMYAAFQPWGGWLVEIEEPTKPTT